MTASVVFIQSELPQEKGEEGGIDRTIEVTGCSASALSL